MVKLLRKRKPDFILVSFAIIFLFLTFPGKGGLEGDQRSIQLFSNRTDNWGFATPFLYGEWPNFFGHWRFTLVLVQLVIFWIGLWLLFSNFKIVTRTQTIFISILVFFSTVFVSQLWRDATLLALATIGYGLLARTLQSKNSKKYGLILSYLILIFAAMFKPLYGPIFALLLIWIYQQENRLKRPSRLLVAISSLLLVVSPYLIDKSLSNHAQMIRVAPEQQPIIFDLASNYCWGQSDQLVKNAAKGLEIVLRPGYPMPSVCASLRPNSWDNLHTNPSKWEFSSPIERLTGARVSRVTELRNRWISMIATNPIDWLQVRLLYLGPTLIMSNSFVTSTNSNLDLPILNSLNSFFWRIISISAATIDKARISSPLSVLLVILFLFGRKLASKHSNANSSISHYQDEIFALLIILTTIAVTIVGFVASNGRYVLPYVLLIYFFLIRSRGLRSPTQV